MATMDPATHQGYETARRMLRRHDPTYYLATRRLPATVRPATYALYGYVRAADGTRRFGWMAEDALAVSSGCR
jgi:phytoene synthase